MCADGVVNMDTREKVRRSIHFIKVFNHIREEVFSRENDRA